LITTVHPTQTPHSHSIDPTTVKFTLLIGHGSRDAQGNDEFLAFVQQLRRIQPNQHFESCFLELAEPNIMEGIDACVRQGATQIVVVPVILLAASHVKLEIPEILDAARCKYPQVELVYGRNIGLHPQLIELLAERFFEQVPSLTAEQLRDTAIVLMGRGSSDADANGDVYKIARQLWERTDVRTVEVCFTGVTSPRFEEGIHRAMALGAKRIVVVPYFLFNGILMKRMIENLERTQLENPQVEMTMAAYFGMHPYLLDIVLNRGEEVLSGTALMNCDLCKYRKLAQQEHEHSHHDHTHAGDPTHSHTHAGEANI
jgi:sirohydrochlorin cobaltochelatase